MRRILQVEPSSAKPYMVWLGADASTVVPQIWRKGWRRAVVIADDNTERLFGERLRAALPVDCITEVVAPGEASKSREQKARIEDAMLEAGIDRSACVVALGGGVVLDLAGFVAATYMRGIDHIVIATTLLAQVDAAIGGKTAINTPHGKNLVGAFHHPRVVCLDTAALDSLPAVEMRNGLAEAVKHAAIADQVLFAQLEAWAARGAGRPPDEVIARCVAIKAEIVAEDDRDRGKRNILNFGHTVAHAIESASDHAVPHGHAVAIGMVVEARVAAASGLFPAQELARLVALLERLGLPTAPPMPFSDAHAHLANDKKTQHAVIHCAIPQRLGEIAPDDEGRWARPVDEEALERAWAPQGGKE